MDLSFSNDPFHLHRSARIETITASSNFKDDDHLRFDTYHGHSEKPHPITIQAAEPYTEHPHSYRHGTLPTFIPNRHARHFRKKNRQQRAPSRDGISTYMVSSCDDSIREAIGRRSRSQSRSRNQVSKVNAGRCRIDTNARPGRGQWYDVLPQTTECAIGVKTHVFATAPFRPRSTAHTTSDKGQAPHTHKNELTNVGSLLRSTAGGSVLIGTSVIDLDATDGSSTARRYRKSVNTRSNTDLLLGKSNKSNNSNNSNNSNSSGGAHTHEESYPMVMVPGVLQISPKTVHLDDACIGQSMTVRLPMTNHTKSCLCHIRPGQIEMTAHNVFAELLSHPTLLAPKMVAICVLQVCGIGGDGHVILSFMGQELCRVYLHGKKLRHYDSVQNGGEAMH